MINRLSTDLDRVELSFERLHDRPDKAMQLDLYSTDSTHSLNRMYFILSREMANQWYFTPVVLPANLDNTTRQ
jgi:hypothetical protein